MSNKNANIRIEQFYCILQLITSCYSDTGKTGRNVDTISCPQYLAELSYIEDSFYRF